MPGSDGGTQLAGGRGAFLWLEVALCHRSASRFLQRRGTAHLRAAYFLPQNRFPASKPPARCYCWRCCSPCAGPWRSSGPGASPSAVSLPLDVGVGCGRGHFGSSVRHLQPLASVSLPLGREGGSAQPMGGSRDAIRLRGPLPSRAEPLAHLSRPSLLR